MRLVEYPYRELICAILWRAWKDLNGPNKILRNEARVFFTSDSCLCLAEWVEIDKSMDGIKKRIPV